MSYSTRLYQRFLAHTLDAHDESTEVHQQAHAVAEMELPELEKELSAITVHNHAQGITGKASFGQDPIGVLKAWRYAHLMSVDAQQR